MKLLNLTAVEFTFAGLQAAIDNIKAQPFFVRLEDLQQKLFQIEIDQKTLSFYEIENPENRHTLQLPAEDKERFFFRGVDLDGGEKVLAFWYDVPYVGINTLNELRAAYADLKAGKTKNVFIQVTDGAILSGFTVQDGEESVQLVQIPTWKGTEKEAIIGRQPYELSELMSEAGEKEGLFNNVWFYLLKNHEDYKASYDPETNLIRLEGTCEATADAFGSTGITLVGMEEVNWNDKALIDAGIAPNAPRLTEIKVWEDGRAVGYLREKFDNSNFDSYVFRHPDGQVDQVTLGAKAVYNEQLIEALIHRYTTLNEEMPHEANVRTKALLEEILEIQSARHADVAERSE